MRSEYYNFIGISDLMPLKNYGFKTHRDDFAIAFEKEEIEERIDTLVKENKTDEEISDLFKLKETSTWKISSARKLLKSDKNWMGNIRKCIYRPFDYRYCYLSKSIMDRPRFPFIKQLLLPNIALATTRSVEIQRGFEHAVCVTSPMDHHGVSLKESNFLFPLYVYPSEEQLQFANERTLNFDERLLVLLLSRLTNSLADEEDVSGMPENEDVFFYIYALLFSPAYRTRYAEFLRNDFPRVPFTSNLQLFGCMADYGKNLADLHTFCSKKLEKYTTFVKGSGEFQVMSVSYSDDTVWINKSKTRGFEGVSEEVWNFHIGGYRVCEKWLKERQAKGGKNPRPARVLTDEDIDHYQKIVVAIRETIRIMDEIDDVIEKYGGWPDAFVSGHDQP